MCYHPLFVFNQLGDLERVMLRRGNHASAKFWRRVLLPVLEREIEHLLKRPVGRPSRKPKVFYHSFQYQAKSWHQPRRVVAKVEWHQGELFARVGFIVTNLTWRSKRVVRFYNGRGTAEQWIKKGKNAVKWTKLSCRTFKDNQARLQLFALAYNLGRHVGLAKKPLRAEICSGFGASDGEDMACGQQTTPKPPLRRGCRVWRSPETFDFGRPIGAPVESRQPFC